MTVADIPVDNVLLSLFNIQLALKSTDAEEHYNAHLEKICRTMLLDYDLCIGDQRYSMLEVEGYLNAPNHHHPDPYCHGHPLQNRHGFWYYHHLGKSSGFKGGSRKGVDITIGHPDHGTTGGVLIRAIMENETGRLIEGPSLLVDEILSVLGHESIKHMVQARWIDQKLTGLCWEKKGGLYLEKKKDVEEKEDGPRLKRRKLSVGKNDKIYSSCRIGLGLTNHTPSLDVRLSFVGRRHRFVVRPHLLKKGRIWTILGMFEDGLSNQEIANLTGCKVKLVEEYRAQYKLGQEQAVETIKQCLKKDILSGGAAWKIRAMSAVRWWQEQVRQGKESKFVAK